MTPIPNKLMPWLQACAAMLLLALWCLMVLGPMMGLLPSDPDLKETSKNIMLILVGFLFGSSASAAKKDDQNTALTAAAMGSTGNGLTGATPAGTPTDPVATKEVKT